MKIAPLHPKENERIASLQELQILDTLHEKEFDEITMLASEICKTPMALISLVDSNRQWFKASTGVGAKETPRDLAFCAHAILDDKIFEVHDAKLDERFFDNPLVTGETKIEFYTGIPIRSPRSELEIGTLCVLDNIPRRLDQKQKDCLVSLRNQVERLLHLRTHMREIQKSHLEYEQLTQRQDLILEGAGLGAWDWWLDSNRVQFDRRWCEMLGLNPSDVSHELKTWESLVHPEDKQRAYNDIQNYMNGKTKEYQNIHRLRHANGNWLWILDRGKMSEWTKAGKPLRFTGTHFNITHFKKGEQISNKVQQIAQIGGWELDLQTKQTRWTDQTYRIHEISLDVPTNEIMGIEFYMPHERERIAQFVAACAEGVPFLEKFEFMDAKNVKKWVEVSGLPETNADGKVTVVTGTFQDITNRINAECALEKLRMNAAQTNKLVSLGEVSAGVAHEINNPLAIISGMLNMLVKYKNDEALFNSKIEILKKALLRINKIVSGLQKFSRSPTNVVKKVSSLEAIVKNALTIVEAKSNLEFIQIDIQTNSDLSILCDEMEIEQVIINLINNAVDAAKSVSSDPWVRFRMFKRDRLGIIQVEDSGPGINKEIEDKIFDPFFTTKPIGQGTGLGLSICKGILDHHNAKIFLNKEFKNTCFEIHFELPDVAENTA